MTRRTAFFAIALLSSVGAGASLAPHAHAQDTVAPFMGCLGVVDTESRLACFDDAAQTVIAWRNSMKPSEKTGLEDPFEAASTLLSCVAVTAATERLDCYANKASTVLAKQTGGGPSKGIPGQEPHDHNNRMDDGDQEFEPVSEDDPS